MQGNSILTIHTPLLHGVPKICVVQRASFLCFTTKRYRSGGGMSLLCLPHNNLKILVSPIRLICTSDSSEGMA